MVSAITAKFSTTVDTTNRGRAASKGVTVAVVSLVLAMRKYKQMKERA